MKKMILNLLEAKKKIKVKFKKSDGSERTMICIPYSEIPEKDKPRKTEKTNHHRTLIKVYEENNGWRSFHSSSVLEVEEI